MDRVREWLQSISLHQYVDAFENKGWDDMDVVLCMTEEEVKCVVNKPGHVRKILLSIKRLNDEQQKENTEKHDKTTTKGNNSDTTTLASTTGTVSRLNDETLTLISANAAAATATAAATAAASNIIKAGHDSVANITVEKGNVLECHNSALKHIVATHALSNPPKEQAYIQQTTDVKEHMYDGDDLCSGWNNDCQELAVTDSDDSSENDSTSIACIQSGHINTTTTGMAIVAKKGMPMSLTKNTIVKDSKNVTIAKKVQYVTTEVKGTTSNFETQISSCLKTYQNRENLFVKTRAYKDAVDILEDRNWVVVIGNPGDGKSTIAYQLLLDHERKCYDPIIVTSPHDWKKMVRGKSKQSNKQVVLIDDMFGVSNVHDANVNKWLSLLEVMRNVVSDRKGDLKVVCTNRRSIFNQVVNKVHKFKEFGKLAIVDLTVVPFSLSFDEKITILSTYLNHYHISESFIIGEIASIDFNYGFPHCVEIFCTNSIIRKQGADFFRFPLKFVENEVEDYQKNDKRKYCALLLVLLSDDNAVCLDDLDETSETFCTCLKLAGLSGSNTIYTLNDAFISLENVYLIRDERSYAFKHDSFREIVAIHFSKSFPKYGIKLLDLHFLISRTRLKESVTSNVEVSVSLPESNIPFLAERFTHEILNGNGYRVFTHNCWFDSDFIEYWLHYVTSTEESKNSLLANCLQQRYTIVYFELSFLVCLCAFKLEELLIRLLSSKELSSYYEKSTLSEQAHEALVFAAFHNLSSSILQLLVSAGADVNAQLKVIDRYFCSYLFVCPQNNTTSLFYAAKHGNLKSVQVLLTNGASLFNAMQPTFSIIQEVVGHSVEILEYILQHIANRGHYVKEHERRGIKMLMVKHFIGVDYSCFFSRCMIRHAESSDIVKVLTEIPCNVESPSRDGDISISPPHISHIPTKYLTKEIIENLHDRNADFNIVDDNGMTVLHSLLQQKHFLLNSANSLEVILSLVNVSDCNKVDSYGCTSLFYALRQSGELRKEIVDVLLEKSDVTIKNVSQRNCLHSLAFSPMHKYLDSYVKTLTEKGVDINAFDSFGNTPMVYSNSFDTMMVFFRNGARLDIENENGANLLMQMLVNNPVDIIGKVSFLLEHGTNVNGKDAQNKTVVHYLIDSPCTLETEKAVFKLLLKHGCNSHTEPNTMKSIIAQVLQSPSCQIDFFDLLMNVSSGPIMQHGNVTEYLLEELDISKVNVDKKLQIVKVFQKYQKVEFCLELYASFLKWEFDTKLSCVHMLSMIKISELQVPNLIRLTLTGPISEQRKRLLLESLLSQVPIDLGNCDDLVQDSDIKWNLLCSPLCVHILVSHGLEIDGLVVDIGCLRKLISQPNFLNTLKECAYVDFNKTIIGPKHMSLIVTECAKQNLLRKMSDLQQLQCGMELDYNVTDEFGNTVLHNLMANGHDVHVNLIRYICTFPLVDVNLKNLKKETPLLLACTTRTLQLQKVTCLVKHGGDLHYSEYVDGLSPLHHLMLRHGWDHGELWGLLIFLMEEEITMTCLDNYGKTPLMYLLENKDLSFLSKEKSINLFQNLKYDCKEDMESNTLLHYIAASNIPDETKACIAGMFIEKGIKANSLNRRGHYPIENALYSQYSSIMLCRELSRGVPIDMVAQCLINNVKHTSDASLEEALADQILNTKEFLDFQDITGITFLSMACRFHRVLLVARLLNAGADPNIPDMLGHSSILSLLFSEVAIDIGLWFCQCFGCDILDELDFVKRNEWPWVFLPDEAYLQLCKMFLPINGNINFDLHSKVIGTININLEILQLLLKHGADPNLVDMHGKTPLHYCAEAPHIDTLICPFMEVLLSHGANVNAEDFKGRTPLMLCAAYERTKYRRMNILLKAGADIFCEDEDGKVVQDYTLQAAWKMRYAMGSHG